MSWSITIARVAGSEIRIHLTFLLLLAWVGFAQYSTGGTEVAIDTLERMRSIGVRISIDDFGTGHSSLSYLKRFPIHRLKIDKAFVSSLLADRKDEAITRAIIGMAQNLELSSVAEGVETPEQLEFLRGLGCDEVQGYLVARPLPVEQAGEFLGRGAVLDPARN